MSDPQKPFIESVKQWIKIDDTIRETTLKIRDLKDQKKDLESKIVEHMKKSEQDVLNISSGGTLRVSLSRTKSGLKEDYIRDVLDRFTRDPDQTASIVSALMSDRPVTERTYLKRCQARRKNEG